MRKTTIGAVLIGTLISLSLAMPAAARTSLGGIDQKLDAIISGIGEPTRIILRGDLLETDIVLSGPDREFVIPDGKRFFVREVACTAVSFSVQLGTRSFGLLVSASIRNPADNSGLRLIVASTDAAGENLRNIIRGVFESNTFVEGGERLILDFFRVGGGTDGSIGRLSCVLTGFMTDM